METQTKTDNKSKTKKIFINNRKSKRQIERMQRRLKRKINGHKTK